MYRRLTETDQLLTRSNYSKPELLLSWLTLKDCIQVIGLDMSPTDGPMLVGGRFGIGVLHQRILREQRRLMRVTLEEDRHRDLSWLLRLSRGNTAVRTNLERKSQGEVLGMSVEEVASENACPFLEGAVDTSA